MASRATLTLLPRRAGPSTLQARPFSHSLVLRAGPNKKSNPSPIRQNPLIGNYKPAPSAAEERDASVSTEHPNATRTPSPARSPVSSAEVAPNADLPPRPPRFSNVTATAEDARPAPRFPYDATSPNTTPRNTDPSSSPTKRTTSIDFLSMLDTRNSIHNQSISSLDPLARPKVRASAVTGRTIFVGNRHGENSAATMPQALVTLSRLVKQQGIKNKFHYQRFHERRGMKKKRLRMVRWRMQFKKGFRETVRRVMELKRQGW